jgi:hypothetical protein
LYNAPITLYITFFCCNAKGESPSGKESPSLKTSGCTSILKPGKVPVIKMKVLISHACDPTVPSATNWEPMNLVFSISKKWFEHHLNKTTTFTTGVKFSMDIHGGSDIHGSSDPIGKQTASDECS